MTHKKWPPNAPTSKGLSKSVVANDNPHIANRRHDSKRLVTFRSIDGQVWTYGGKRGRVLALLADNPAGVTQWDTLPWHTRLGGTVFVMRGDGLPIETELEGEYRHARYRLTVAGSVMSQTQKQGANDE